MRITVHGGHGPHGKLGAGAVGFCSESLVDRKIKDSTIKFGKQGGHTMFDCTVETAGTQSGIVSKIKKNINSYAADINLSIHLNANKKSAKDGVTKGVECWIYPGDNKALAYANKICSAIMELGFKNRGVKTSSSLGVLKGIKNGGVNILIECFFCDDQDDFLLYSKLGSDAFGKAIIEAVTGQKIQNGKSESKTVLGKYQITDPKFGKLDLGYVFEPGYYRANAPKNAEEKQIFAKATDTQLFEHFKTFGMKEGRQGHAYFNVGVYRERYLDLKNKYGSDLPSYYKHYCVTGVLEGRKGI